MLAARGNGESDGRGPSVQQSVIIEEWMGSSSSKLSLTAIISSASTSSSFSIRKFGGGFGVAWKGLIGAFVPEGFPSSVAPDYVPFQLWDSLQGLSTYIRMMLSTQALLGAIGVGARSATVIGATFQWFLRDLTGMLGGILFTFYQGSDLDCNAKMWRLVADLMNDLGMLMDLVSPLFPSALVFIVCLGSLSRSFTGVASGATRAALTQHFALQNNAADIAAKEGSQETLATMIGMGIGMLLARNLEGHPVSTWFCFLFLTMFHMYANYRAVTYLSLNTLNTERSSILLQHFMKTGEVLTPKQVARKEHVFPSFMHPWNWSNSKFSHRSVNLGVKVSALSHNNMMNLFHCVGSYYKRAKYVLLENKGKICIVLHKDSTEADALQSFTHALAMLNLSDKNLHAESWSWMDKHYKDFLSKLQSSGWKTGRLLIQPVAWKADWKCPPSVEKIN